MANVKPFVWIMQKYKMACVCNTQDHYDTTPVDGHCICENGYHMIEDGSCVKNSALNCGPKYNAPDNPSQIKRCTDDNLGNTSYCSDDGECVFQCNRDENYDQIILEPQAEDYKKYTCIQNIIQIEETIQTEDSEIKRNYYDCVEKTANVKCTGPKEKSCDESRKNSGMCICPDGFLTINDNGTLIKAACIGDAQDFYEFEISNAGFQSSDPRWNTETNKDNAYILMNNIRFFLYPLLQTNQLSWMGIGWSDGSLENKMPGFTGKFYGNNKTITMGTVHCNQATESGCGLFSKLIGATVKDLNIDISLTIEASNTPIPIGSIAGAVVGNTVIDHCTVQGSVQARRYIQYLNTSYLSVGGMIGIAEGDASGEPLITNSTANMYVYCDAVIPENCDSSCGASKVVPMHCGGLIGTAHNTHLENVAYDNQPHTITCITPHSSCICSNNHDCSTTPKKSIYALVGSVGGIVGDIENSKISTATVKTLFNPSNGSFGTIESILPKNIKQEYTNYIKDQSYVGGIAGTAKDTLIQKAKVIFQYPTDDTSISMLSGGDAKGGLVGKYTGTDNEKAQISDSSFTDNLCSNGKSTTENLIGEIEGNVTLDQCDCK